MRAEIIATAQWKSAKEFESLRKAVCEELACAGVEVFCTNTAAGSEEKLGSLLRLALSRSDAVVICAPIGVGESNSAAKSVCDALGLQVVKNEAVHRSVTEYFDETGETPTESDLDIALLPLGAVVFPGKEKLGIGCAIRSSHQCILILPQNTQELIPMLRESVVPYLSALGAGAVSSETVKIFYYGATCGEVEEELEKLELKDVSYELTEKFGEVSVHISARAKDAKLAADIAAANADKIRAYFGLDALGRRYSSLEEDVVEMLKKHHLTLATAESCTAGLISKRITDVPGASKVFGLGAATYATEKKHEVLGVANELIEKYGVVSSEVAAAMAVGARKLSGSDLAVSVTGYAGPEGGDGKPVGLVYISLCDGEQVWIRRLQLGAGNVDREHIRNEAASHAIDLVRSYLYELPGRLEGGEPCPVEKQNITEAIAVPEAATAAKKPKKKSASDIISKVAFIVALLTMLGSGGYLVYNLVILPYTTSKTVQGVANLIEEQNFENQDILDDSWKYTEDGMLVKYAAVKEKNEDFVAWITIPNTKIDYPVLQSGEKNPEYYLRRDFYGKHDSNGSIFAFYSCNFGKDELSKNTVIFGHNMRSGMMFQNLMYYDVYQTSGAYKSPDYDSNLEFYKANAVFDFNTVYEESEWVVFAVLKLNTLYSHGEPFDFIRTDFADEEEFEAFIEEIRKRSIIDTYGCIDVDEDDYLLTMQTCSYEYSEFRTVIVARKLRKGETVDVSSAFIAENPVMPEVWNR